MSGIAMEWAARQGVKGLAQLVLLRLSFHHNHETGRCDPSIGTIAEGAGISAIKARRCIREIESAGLVEKVIRRVGKVNTSNAYCLRFDLGIQEDGVLSEGQGVLSTGQGGTVPQVGGVLSIGQANKEEEQGRERESAPSSEIPAGKKAKVVSITKAVADVTLPDLPDWIDAEAFRDWMVMRRDDKKKPVTPSVAKASIRTLAKLRDAGEDANKILARATMNSWQGLYADDNGATKADPPAPDEVVYEVIGFEDAYSGSLLTGTETR